MKTSKEKYKESFQDSCFFWNHDLMLMLECPLSQYWTSPLTNKDHNKNYCHMNNIEFN